MARKLVALLALMALMSLASAGAALAETYTLSGGSEEVITWTETYGRDIYNIEHPGNALGDFHGGYLTDWTIASLYNPSKGKVNFQDAIKITYEVTYDSLIAERGIGGGSSDIRFVVNLPGLSISSSDLKVVTTATYKKEKDGTHWYCYQGYDEQNKYIGETMKGEGHDTNNTFFTFAAKLYETQGDSNHYGYITDFELVYPSAVPLPAGVWLLGTGLLGLVCLGWRRRN